MFELTEICKQAVRVVDELYKLSVMIPDSRKKLMFTMHLNIRQILADERKAWEDEQK